MRVFGLNVGKRSQNVGQPPALSRAARFRLKVLDWYQAHGANARLACRHFGISPDTFYRWTRRFNPRDLSTLEDRSRRPRPRQLQQSTWSGELEQAVLALRESSPGWGKDKLVVLLRQQGWQCSTSMVGRILRKLKQTGKLREAPRGDPWLPRKPFRRLYGTRKPKGWAIRAPGDLVQVDTADIRPLPGVAFKHFTARDMFTRWDVVEVYSRATAKAAAGFLDTLLSRMPFPVKAIQVDGGSEFMAQFETACQQREIKLFVLPPRSPKVNGQVERAHRTHREEFCQVVDLPDSLQELREMLRAWEEVYNGYRPHQALGYLTPREFYHRWLAQQCA
jgi:transposase InsO family protein